MSSRQRRINGNNFNRQMKSILIVIYSTCLVVWLCFLSWESTLIYEPKVEGNALELDNANILNQTNDQSMMPSSRRHLENEHDNSGCHVSSTMKYNLKNTTIATCGGRICPIAGISIFPVQTCNEAYTMSVDWIVEIKDNRIGIIDIGQNLKDGYCKKSSLESWGVVAFDKSGKKRVACDFETPNALDIACNSYRPPEHHTFVLWDPSFWVSHEAVLNESLLVEIVDTFVVTENHRKWCLKIYATKFSARRHKYCKPFGNPKVVVVRDPNPVYEKFTSGGGISQLLNKNIYSLKMKMRGMVKVGYLSVHSSHNVEEVKLVLEPLKRQYQYEHQIPELNTIKDVFHVLDQHICFRYVILRSHEEVDLGSSTKEIDILVNDFYMFKAITGAESIDERRMREADNGPNTQNIVGGKWIFNIRYIGDGYYDTAWQLHMLQNRVKTGGVWVQEPLSYAMSLIYHYNVHSRDTNAEPTHLNTIHQKYPLLDSEKSLRARTALQTYMEAHKYDVIRPHDTTVNYHTFESLQTATFENYPLEECLNFKPLVNGTLSHYECVDAEINKTSIGNAIVKKELIEWNPTFGPIINEFSKLNYGPYREYVYSEASNYVNVSSVPLSVASRITFKKVKQEKSLYSIQLMIGELTQFNPNRSNETVFSRVGAGILDYLFDECSRFGFKNQLRENTYFAKYPTGSMVWFDDRKSMGCNGTKSLAVARESILSFWNGWCNFPLSYHVKGLSSFLFEQMSLPNAYVNKDDMRGLQWREQALLEYMKNCNGRNRIT